MGPHGPVILPANPAAGAVAPAVADRVPRGADVAVAGALRVVGSGVPGVVAAAPAVVPGPPEVSGASHADALVPHGRRRAVGPVAVAAPVVLLEARGVLGLLAGGGRG